MHCPGGNATDPIWRLLASSQGISSWTSLKPQHSNPNPNSLANQLWCIDFLTPATPLIIPHRLSAFFESLMPLKNWCSIHARWSKSSLKHSIRFCGIKVRRTRHAGHYRSRDELISDILLWTPSHGRYPMPLISHPSLLRTFERYQLPLILPSLASYTIFQVSSSILQESCPH